MSVKNEYAVLLINGGNFIKIKNKNYSVGDKINTSRSIRRICATAASILLFGIGFGSYFIPAGYISVDINPSIMITVNIYDIIIDAHALNYDAERLLDNMDIKGENTGDTIGALIKKSEEMGYLNKNNKDVIIEVVSNIGEINIDVGYYKDIILEKAEKSDLKIADDMNISIARAKAITEYTDKNGGTIEENAKRLENKSVKDIKNDLINAANISDLTSDSGGRTYSDILDENKKAEIVPQESISDTVIKNNEKALNTAGKEQQKKKSVDGRTEKNSVGGTYNSFDVQNDVPSGKFPFHITNTEKENIKDISGEKREQDNQDAGKDIRTENGKIENSIVYEKPDMDNSSAKSPSGKEKENFTNNIDKSVMKDNTVINKKPAGTNNKQNTNIRESEENYDDIGITEEIPSDKDIKQGGEDITNNSHDDGGSLEDEKPNNRDIGQEGNFTDTSGNPNNSDNGFAERGSVNEKIDDNIPQENNKFGNKEMPPYELPNDDNRKGERYENMPPNENLTD